MKKKISLFLGLVLSFMFIFSSPVSARKVLLNSSVNTTQEGEVGSITLYDDYVMRFSYKYEVSEIKISICPKDDCVEETTQNYTSNQQYFDDEYVDIYLSEHFTLEDEIEYTLTTSAKFKPFAAAINEVSIGSASKDFVYEDVNVSEKPKDDGYGDEIVSETEKVKNIFVKYGIPVIYGVLVVLLIVKGILLGMDVSKYADQPDIRREKIRGFTYFGVAIVALIGLNTFLGFYTGLFG